MFKLEPNKPRTLDTAMDESMKKVTLNPKQNRFPAVIFISKTFNGPCGLHFSNEFSYVIKEQSYNFISNDDLKKNYLPLY